MKPFKHLCGVLSSTLLFATPSPATTFIVTSGADAGPGTLRQAIADANASPGSHRIEFRLPGSGVRTLAPLSELPAITNSVTIDGYSQPGSSPNTLQSGNDARLLLRLDGVNLSNGIPTALTVRAGGCTVRGLIIVRFGYGIQIQTSSGNIISGNWIGLDADGISRGMTFDGIHVNGQSGPAMNNRVGGPLYSDANIISGNRNGISFFPDSAAHNSVMGNLIGTDPTGRLPRGNVFAAISVQSATNLTISGNVLSACTGAGGSGIKITGGSGHVIRNNLIGHGVSGQDLGNSSDGISAQGASTLLIGGDPGQGNRIGFNRGNGVGLLGCNDAAVRHNNIGSGSTGAEPWGNLESGVYVNGGTSNLISGNQVLFNGAAGITVLSGTANRFTANSIFDNGGIGIDLGADGITPNDNQDLDTGANQFQNHPALGDAHAAYGSLHIQGTLSSQPLTTFLIEFFASEPWDPFWIAEGQVFLGAATVTTDGIGNVDLSFTGASPSWIEPGAELLVTATATDPQGNTSEFSPAIPLNVGPSSVALSISQKDGLTQIAWPGSATAGGYELESSTSVTPPAHWETVTNGITGNGDLNIFATTNGASPVQFFRLRKP